MRQIHDEAFEQQLCAIAIPRQDYLTPAGEVVDCPWVSSISTWPVAAHPAFRIVIVSDSGWNMMKVYGDLASGNCLKVKYTADHLSFAYEWNAVDIHNGGARTEEFLSVNPAGQVPVLVMPDGRTLAQSNAIIQFLAEGSPLLPSDPFDRAKVNQWLFWEQYSHEPYIAVCRFHMFYAGKARDEREQWRVERGERALDLMEQELDGRTWLAVDQFTLADIALLAYTRLAHEGGFDLSNRPNITRWISGCENVLSI